MNDNGQAYDKFARYYDRAMGDRSTAGLFLVSLLKRHAPTAQTLIEFGCGTGAMLDIFKKDYEVSGVDNCPQMLEIASCKIPNAHLKLADLTQLELDNTFDIVCCLFDTLNHLLAYEDWIKVFNVAKKHLNHGGVFVFDINSASRLGQMTSWPMVSEWSNSFMLLKIRQVAVDLFGFDMRIFELAGEKLYRLVLEHTIWERTVLLPQLLADLRTIFPQVLTYDVDGNNTEGRDCGRIYLVCKK
jgi:SAM-dependent methyltransferase